jgi:hypothetical protein
MDRYVGRSGRASALSPLRTLARARCALGSRTASSIVAMAAARSPFRRSMSARTIKACALFRSLFATASRASSEADGKSSIGGSSEDVPAR